MKSYISWLILTWTWTLHFSEFSAPPPPPPIPVLFGVWGIVWGGGDHRISHSWRDLLVCVGTLNFWSFFAFSKNRPELSGSLPFSCCNICLYFFSFLANSKYSQTFQRLFGLIWCFVVVTWFGYVVQCDFELLFLPLLPRCCDYRPMSPCPAYNTQL